ncbi:MAG: hypothetical protein QXU70_04710, partial [Thermoplasmatales archaeon]
NGSSGNFRTNRQVQVIELCHNITSHKGIISIINEIKAYSNKKGIIDLSDRNSCGDIVVFPKYGM